MRLGSGFRYFRRISGYSEADLAYLINYHNGPLLDDKQVLTARHIVEIEENLIEPSLMVMTAMARALDVSIEKIQRNAEVAGPLDCSSKRKADQLGSVVPFKRPKAS